MFILRINQIGGPYICNIREPQYNYTVEKIQHEQRLIILGFCFDLEKKLFVRYNK